MAARLEEMAGQIAHLEELVSDDITTVISAEDKYKGNKYQTYSEAVNEIHSKYNGNADWGVLQTGNIIDTRSAFIIGQGINIIGDKKDAQKELDFIHEFFNFNDLDREGAQEFAKEAEIEGKYLGKLFWHEKAKMVALRFVSWTEYNYKIIADPNDYLRYEKATWKKNNTVTTLTEDQFVYKKFGGRVNKPDDSPPKIAKCLTQIEHLDKALRDWREIDRLFAAPTPHIECKTAEEAKKMNDLLEAKNIFKIRKMFAHTGTFKYTSPDPGHYQSIKDEILSNTQIISGTVGMPVHFLGYPELMSNRSTAWDLKDLVNASTLKERKIWQGGYEEIIEKAMAMWSAKGNKQKLDPSKISVEIPFWSQEQWDRFEKVYLPGYIAGAFSLEYILSQLPGLDVEKEMARREQETERNMERQKKFFGTGGKGDSDDDEGDEDEE